MSSEYGAQSEPQVRSSELVGLRGTARCVRCGYLQHDMPLDRLDEYGCGKYDTKAGQMCGGWYVAVKKRKQPNIRISDMRTDRDAL